MLGLYASAMASRSRGGVIGVIRCRTPRCDSRNVCSCVMNELSATTSLRDTAASSLGCAENEDAGAVPARSAGGTAAYTGDVVLLATDEDRAGISMQALVRLAGDHGVHMTRSKVVKLLYLADLRSVASDGKALSGILWRWWHYGPYCQSLRKVEDRLVADGVIERNTSRLSTDIEEAVLSASRTSADVSAQAGDFLAHLEAVLEDYGRHTARSLTDMAYDTVPMLEARRVGERGVLLDMHEARTDIADVDAVMSAIADRPDLVVMPQIDVSALGTPDAAEIVGVFRGNRVRANRRLLAD